MLDDMNLQSDKKAPLMVLPVERKKVSEGLKELFAIRSLAQDARALMHVYLYMHIAHSLSYTH